MEVRNDYRNCPTNIACSIRKYFELSQKHDGLKILDKILAEKQPENVVMMLFDGMGSKILARTLPENSFFRQHQVKELTTVFPPTTAAATNSFRTGLNPAEHGWLGWNTYIPPIDKVITVFRDCEKGDENQLPSPEFLKVKNQLSHDFISREINDQGKFSAHDFFPFPQQDATVYKNLDQMLDLVLSETKKPGKKFIYAYDTEPDHSMHIFGPDSPEVKKLIKERDQKVAKFAKKLKNTLLIIVADHGHRKVKNVFLREYPDFYQMLARLTSIEPRAVSFKIKPEFMTEFPEKFNQLFGKDFDLYPRDEVLKSQLFGDGQPHSWFKDQLGDFLAIAHPDSNLCLLDRGDPALFSQHTGISDDELFIPLILIDRS